MIAAMIMARANRAAEAKAVAELAPFPKTGLRSHRHRQPHGPSALGQPERHETPDPARSNAVEPRFHGARLIEHEYVVQESKPNKRLYSIGPAGSEALASWLGSTINVPEMRHHMMMRLFLGNLLPIEETSRLLIGYRDRMAARAESYRQAKERFSRSLSGPYRASVFFELLSLDHLIAMTDLEVTGTDKALAALRRFGSDGALASAEQASDLLDTIRDVS